VDVVQPTVELDEVGVVDRLAASRVVPVATITRPTDAEAVGRALIAGGITTLEVAFRTPEAAAAIRAARRVEGLTVGAGTVLTPELVDVAVEAGAQFAVAPGLNERVVAAAAARRLPFFPGVATPTEIERARELGLRVLKVFPVAQLGGVAFLKAVGATYPDVRFLPTGGVGPADVAAYLSLPAVVACGGSWLTARELLEAGRWQEVERLAREAVGA
jgi:2-dehydro-3-deoxyphosphogluconate aldolase/(4S)-4-hydroxy-2-oxoglutarate aldolase